VLILKKAIYGLVQAARKWWKKFKEAMAGCNYFPSKGDPCLFLRRLMVIIYVDDRGIIGTPEAIKEVVKALSK
jgi:hypothetical protein